MSRFGSEIFSVSDSRFSLRRGHVGSGSSVLSSLVSTYPSAL